MFAPKNEAILELLAMTIFVDNKVIPAEVDSFIEVVQNLDHQGIINIKVPELSLILWYEVNVESLWSTMGSPEFENWLEARLKTLNDFENKLALIEAIAEISKADEEEHDHEIKFVKMIAKGWGYDVDAAERTAA